MYSPRVVYSEGIVHREAALLHHILVRPEKGRRTGTEILRRNRISVPVGQHEQFRLVGEGEAVRAAPRGLT